VPARDLLGSSATANEFVAEADDSGQTTLRFGDGLHYGARPREEITYLAAYRVGNGSAANVAAGSVFHIVGGSKLAGTAVDNPLPAGGGVDPEPIEDVRQKAPVAFRTQRRAVTPDDYARVAETYPDNDRPQVQRAVATFRWTGSWHTVFVIVDPVAGVTADADFRAAVRAFLEPYRMAGHDVEVEGPIYVPLEIEMTVCVKPDYFRDTVQQALQAAFTSGRLPDGRPGVFFADNFTFGQTVYLSPLYAAAQAVDGVDSVRITKFQRWGLDSDVALQLGMLTLGRLEVARLDNDPSFPDHGVFRLTLLGGK
jgi:predicted phage baseplate assembly protein